MALNHHVGYSRENECWFVRFYPYQTEQQAKDAVSDFTRPAAPVGGLDRFSLVWSEEPTHYSYIEPNPMGNYVLFSQAEAIIAAERSEKEKADKRVEFLLKQISRAAGERKAIEADNAALTARVKVLEADVSAYILSAEDQDKKRKTLETQIAAAKKALTEIYGNGDATGCNPQIKVDIARAALEAKP